VAGAFAHMLLVDSLCKDSVLASIDTLTPNMRRALSESINSCRLGSVSPDCPFMVFEDEDAKAWGNVMHYWKTAEFIRRAIRKATELDLGGIDGRRCFAWLCGYAAHVVTDLTIHPIVKAKVGPYADNATKHRECEMNQDVYIFYRERHEELNKVDYLSAKSGGIASCHDPADHQKLYPRITMLWTYCLAHNLDREPLDRIDMGAGLNAPTARPDPDKWFHRYVKLIEETAKVSGQLPYWGRHMGEEKALAYPCYSEIVPGFINGLNTPTGGVTDYDQVFARAAANMKQAWKELGAAFNSRAPLLFTLKDSDLDTGLEEPAQSIYWSN